MLLCVLLRLAVVAVAVAPAMAAPRPQWLHDRRDVRELKEWPDDRKDIQELKEWLQDRRDIQEVLQGRPIQELNEVWASGPSPSPIHEHIKQRFSFRTLVHALAMLGAFETGSQLELTEVTVPPDDSLEGLPTADPSASPGLPDDRSLDVSEDLLDVPTPAPVDDDALNIKPIFKPDKSYRFTHNFRFGYGALPGLP